MKRITLLLAAAVLGMAAATAAVYTLPFSLTPSEETFAECTVLDENHDAETDGAGDIAGGWSYYGNPKFAFKYKYSVDNQADDWLIMPAVTFGSDLKVKISFQIETYSDLEDFEVRLGHEPTVAAMTQVVLTKSNFKQTSFGELSAVIRVPDDGDDMWYLGFHVTSPAFRGWIYLKDIKIESAAEPVAAVPNAPMIMQSSIDFQDYSADVFAPTTDNQGNALSGPMNLEMLVDGNVLNTIENVESGAMWKVRYKVPVGEHVIGFRAVQNGAVGEEVTETVTSVAKSFVPKAPEIVECNVIGTTMYAKLKMPTEYVDGRAITDELTIVISVDGEVPGADFQCQPGEEQQVSCPLTEGRHTIGFTVWTQADSPSEQVTTVVEVAAPPATLPFTFEATADNFARCEVVDVNGDGDNGNGEWTFSEGAFQYKFSSDYAADDWLILPFVDFGDVRKVMVSFKVKTGGYEEGFELMLGTARTVAAMTIPVLKKENFKAADGYVELSASVALPAGAPSVQCLGIHAISARDMYYFSIKDIVIEADNAVAPAAPEIKESAMDALAYTATVAMPRLDVEGNAITAPLSLEISLDGEVVETRTDCAPGNDVAVALTLETGNHTISYTAVMGRLKSESVSEEVTAASIVTGELPFTFVASQETFDQCVIEDIDGSVENYGNIQGAWSYAIGNGFKYTYHPSSQADDWLILPLVNFGESTRVKISVDVKTEYDTEAFEIWLGRERTASAMTLKVMERSSFKSTTWITLTAEIDIPAAESRAAGNFFAPAIHAISPANHYNMYFDNIKLEALASTPTGVDAIETADDAEREYYNLQGIRVENPGHGVYIVRQGTNVFKVRL